MERVPATLAITLPALALKIGLGIPAGIYAALHRNSMADRLTMAASVAGFTMPSFVLALAAGAGLRGPARLAAGQRQRDLPSTPSCPSSPWARAGAAIMARFTRSAMLEVLGQPYIRAASAKGVDLARAW